MAVVRVGAFGSRMEAELARGMLEAHGYRSEVADEIRYGADTPRGTGPCLLVEEADAPEVVRLLEEAASREQPPEADPYASPFAPPPTETPRARLARRVIVAAPLLVVVLMLWAEYA